MADPERSTIPRPSGEHPRETRPEQPLDRTDRWVAAGVGGVALLVFLSTFSGHNGFGDAPETVGGIRSLGILRAPGHVTYVVAARAFGEAVSIGSWDFRVNLFSLVCATLCIVGVYLLARILGGSRSGAAIAAIALASAASFWFDAGFARYYAFSALLVTLIALCMLHWQQRHRGALLVIAGALIGSSVGVSWPIAGLMAAGAAIVLLRGRPRPGTKLVVAAVGSGVLTAVAVCAWVLVRAGEDPTLNFDRATNVSRMWGLLTTADFTALASTTGTGFGHFLPNTANHLAAIGRDVGYGAIALALIGVFDLYDRRRLDHGLFLAVAGLGNVLVVAYLSAKVEINGFSLGLDSGGTLVAAFIVVAMLAGLGASRLVYWARRWSDARSPDARSPDASPDPSGRSAVAIAVVVVMVGAVIVPSLVVHRDRSDHTNPAFAVRYAHRILAALPKDSVFLAGSYESAQPVLYLQLIHGDRPDVTVVYADQLVHEWYREQVVIRHRRRLDLSLVKATPENQIARFVAAVRATRPVYTDAYGMLVEGKLFGYQAEGLVGRVVDGVGPQAGPNFVKAAATLRSKEEADQVTRQKFRKYPNASLFFLYERAHIELAKQYALADQLDEAAKELERSLQFGNSARRVIPAVRNHQADAKQLILAQ